MSKNWENRKVGKKGRKARPSRNDMVDGMLLDAGASLTRIGEAFMPLFPPKVKRTLRYQENIDVTSTSGSLASYVFSANGLYDCNISGTGHQPMGFDQMMVFFEHYVVEEARIRVVLNNTGAAANKGGVRLDPSANAATNIQQMLEFGGLSYEAFEAKNTYGCSKTVSLKCNIGKIQGVSRSALTADVNLRGDIASNPSEQTYFHIVVWDPASNTFTSKCDVIIEFDAIFTEPRVATQSITMAAQTEERKAAFFARKNITYKAPESEAKISCCCAPCSKTS